MKTSAISHRPTIIVYEDGRIYSTSLDRFLKPSPSSKSNGGYLRVSINGHKVPVQVLVAEAFIGPRPSAWHLCLHKDDNPRNNTVENLYWGTKKQNAIDSVRNGKTPVGEKSHSAKLSERAVTLIRDLAASGEKHSVLSNSFNVSQSTITDIVNRKKWKHLK